MPSEPRSGHVLDALLKLGQPLFERRRLKKLLFPYAERLARKLARDHLQAAEDEEPIAALMPVWQQRFGVYLALSTRATSIKAIEAEEVMLRSLEASLSSLWRTHERKEVDD